MNDESPKKSEQVEERPDIFLKEAIDEQFSFKRLDQILVVIRRKDWIAYLAIALLLVLFLLWGFLGSIPVTAMGKGIVLDLNQMATILSQVDGVVEDVLVKQGDVVKEDQLLMVLHNPIVAFEHKFYQERSKTVQEEYNALVDQVKKERVSRESFLNEQASSTEAAKGNKVKEIEIIKKSLEAEEVLLQKNLLSLPTVNRTRLDLLAAETELENILAKIKETAFEQTKDYRQTEIWEKEALLNEVRRQFGVAEIQFRETMIFSQESGKIVNNFTYPGLAVDKGSPLLILQKSTDDTPPRYFYSYIPSDIAKGIRPGMAARVELAKYLLKKYGYILGRVKEVSILPVADSDILAKLFNPNLVTSLKEASVGQVIIELEKANTPTGYRWSSGIGPKDPITIGNIGTVHVIVDRIAPIYFLIPSWVKNEDRP